MKEFNPRPIELLPQTEFKVLKVIKLEGPKHSPFSGYLPYLRDLTKEYTEKNTDAIDEVIIDVIKTSLPDSFLVRSINILFKGILDDNLKSINGGSEKDITIQFSPELPNGDFEQISGKQLYTYLLNFKARMLFSKDSDKKHYIHNHLICSLPHENLKELVKSIQPV